MDCVLAGVDLVRWPLLDKKYNFIIYLPHTKTGYFFNPLYLQGQTFTQAYMGVSLKPRREGLHRTVHRKGFLYTYQHDDFGLLDSEVSCLQAPL